MMDYGFVDDISAQEALNESKCRFAAFKAGYTVDEADECDSGELDCPACPWGNLE